MKLGMGCLIAPGIVLTSAPIVSDHETKNKPSCV